MTVCIAARCDNGVIIGACDRMLTTGDIKFEPSAANKIVTLTNSIAVMSSGDASFQAEILRDVCAAVQGRITAAPQDWLYVKEVVDFYVGMRNAAKLRRSEAAVLAPLGMDRVSFFANQRLMDPKLAHDLTGELLNYRVPGVSTIFTGVDHDGPHIYVVDDGDVRCNDLVGFAAIGMGERHAESQFMQARHHPHVPVTDTLMLTYLAKKRAEVAPGVGLETDMFVIGAALGTFAPIPQNVLAKLQLEYQRITRREAKIQKDVRAEVSKYVEELGKTAAAAQAVKPTDGQPTPADGSAGPGETKPGN